MGPYLVNERNCSGILNAMDFKSRDSSVEKREEIMKVDEKMLGVHIAQR
jgi:hypothetical protein